jgi:hypothetical protein
VEQDRFKSQAPAPKTPTRGLGPTGTRPLAASGSLAVPEPELRERAADLLEKLEQRIEVLIQACTKAGLPMPGVVVRPCRFPLSPNAAQVVAYLGTALQANARLAQAVQVAIFRFQEVGRAIRWRELEQPGQATDLEALRRHVFYLNNLSAEFKQDRILASIFPPPQTQTATLGHLQRSKEQRQRDLGVRKDLYDKGVALVQRLAPKMVVVQLALESLEKGITTNMATLLTPQGRQAKVLALALGADPGTTAKLNKAYHQYLALKELLPRLRAGEAELEQLRALAVPLGQLPVVFAAHAILRELFAGAPARVSASA